MSSSDSGLFAHLVQHAPDDRLQFCTVAWRTIFWMKETVPDRLIQILVVDHFLQDLEAVIGRDIVQIASFVFSKWRDHGRLL